ncbi:MAG: YbjQ family protein [Micrococcaceae bacterium]
MPMMVTTTNTIPGWKIQYVCGEVFGLTARSRNIFSQFGASLKTIVGGEMQGMTTNLITSRFEAVERMINEATQKGGNCIVGMRFDTSELGELGSEVAAYGTAVFAVPVNDAAKEQAKRMGYS